MGLFVINQHLCNNAQDYPNLKIFIYDDGSTDGSIEEVEKYLSQFNLPEDKIHITAATHNRGISQTRTRMFDWSRDENPHAYTLWLDSDDQYTDTHFVSKIITQMLVTKADICLYNFSIQFEDASQKSNAAVLLKDKESIGQILQAINGSPQQAIHPADMPNLLQFSSLGWTKCYAPTVELPRAADCPYEDFVYMAALLQANTITALPPEEEPLEYLRRSTSICGQRQHDNFALHIPTQLLTFFNTVLHHTDQQVDQLQKLRMAQRFVADKLMQYAKILDQFVINKSFAGIDEKTQAAFLKQAQEINNKIDDEIQQLEIKPANQPLRYAS